MGKKSDASGSSRERTWRGLVDRSRGDSSFVGRALHLYGAAHRLADHEVLSWLGCSVARADRLALCLMPDSADDSFANNVRMIARFVDCNADRLVQLLREVSVLEALRSGRELVVGKGLLMAARDRTDADDPPKEK